MSRFDRLLAGTVVAAALAFGWSGLTAGYEGPYDEGNTLCAATRVLAGETPYRDFWLLHPPGTTWLLAGAFRVFGATLGVERAVKVVVVALTAALVFLLARRAARPLAAAAAALLFVVLPTQTLSLRSRDTGLVLVLATLLAACRPSASPRRRALVAGLLAGFTVFFKQDFVLAAALGGAVAVALAAATRASPGRRARTGDGWKTIFEEGLLPFAAGLVAGPALLAATLAAHGTFAEFLRQAILFPATSFGRFRSLPLSLRFEQLGAAFGPGISSKGVLDAGAVPVLFLVACTAAFVAIGRGGWLVWRRSEGAGRESDSLPALFASSMACLLLLAAPFQRADLEHLNAATALALVVLPALPAPAMGMAAVALVSFASWPGARGVTVPPDLLETARFVAANSAPGERIFVGNARHDRLAYSAPLLYFLSGRTGATRYDNLHPGVATTRPVQEEIVRSLEARGTRWAVLWDGPPPVEPNQSSMSSGVLVLDEWLAGHGREAARFGSYRVLELTPPTTLPRAR